MALEQLEPDPGHCKKRRRQRNKSEEAGKEPPDRPEAWVERSKHADEPRAGSHRIDRDPNGRGRSSGRVDAVQHQPERFRVERRRGFFLMGRLEDRVADFHLGAGREAELGRA